MGSDTPGATSARRIVCASRHPPRPLEAGCLDVWMLGCCEDVKRLRDEEDWEDWKDLQDWGDREDRED